jgi:UDP-N-acetylmuramoylalanine--D-glutamate ligase
LAPAEKLGESLTQLADLPIRFRLGEHDPHDLDGCDLLVVSPAVPKDRSDFVRAAIGRGIPVTAEMNLFVERCPVRKLIGVTGSAGKSTTTAMIGSILQAARAVGVFPQVWMGGNIGHSLLGDLGTMTNDDAVVLELSSFQLEDIGGLRWSPPVAVITNIQPNHLDRHGTLDAYADAKMNIVRYQRPDDIVLIHAGDRTARDYAERAGANGRLRECRVDPVFTNILKVPGNHNLLNAAAAAAAARAIGISDECIARGLAGFRGLPHRLEFVAERDGVKYYNDSKSTTPDSTRIAADAFAGAPVIVLVGGRSKGASYAAMGRLLAGSCRHAICFGEAGPEIYQEVIAGTPGDRPWVGELVPGLTDAVRRARQLARPGDIVVLSPACTSYDEFSNYEQRGETFARQVNE